LERKRRFNNVKTTNHIIDTMVGLPFLKKKKSEIMPGKGSIPTDRVREMASRGFSEPEMIDVLRREGFSASEIDNALTAALKIGVGAEHVSKQPEPVPQQTQQQNQAQDFELPTWDQIRPKTPEPEKGQPLPQIPETSLPEEYYGDYSNEEYIDFAVQTKMQEINDKLNDFKSMNQVLQKKIDGLKDELNKIIQLRSGTSKEVTATLNETNEIISNLEGRIGSLEKAFKDTLPALIESVRGVTDLVQKMKREV